MKHIALANVLVYGGTYQDYVVAAGELMLAGAHYT